MFRNIVRLAFSSAQSAGRLVSTSSIRSNKNGLGEYALIKTEMAFRNEQGENVLHPSEVEDKEFHKMSKMSPCVRNTYYTVLFKRKMSEDADKMKTEIRRLMNAEKREADEANNHILYGLGKNTLYMRILPASMVKWRNRRVLRSLALTNSRLIIDCGFSNTMSSRELINTAKQITLSISRNRQSIQPFYMHMTDMGQEFRKILLKNIPTIETPAFPASVSDKSFAELFPKEKLVYLTPDSNNELSEFNDEDIYIVGAIVDKSESKPWTLSKAKRLGIRTAKLPLDAFATWKKGSKSLTINNMVEILHELKTTGDFRAAFRHLPTRKAESKEPVPSSQEPSTV